MQKATHEFPKQKVIIQTDVYIVNKTKKGSANINLKIKHNPRIYWAANNR